MHLGLIDGSILLLGRPEGYERRHRNPARSIIGSRHGVDVMMNVQEMSGVGKSKAISWDVVGRGRLIYLVPQLPIMSSNRVCNDESTDK